MMYPNVSSALRLSRLFSLSIAWYKSESAVVKNKRPEGRVAAGSGLVLWAGASVQTVEHARICEPVESDYVWSVLTHLSMRDYTVPMMSLSQLVVR